MAHIVVVTHRFDQFARAVEGSDTPQSHFLLFDVLETLRDRGHSWEISAGTEPLPGDAAILHVNATCVPADYLALRHAYPVSVNFGAADISKRHVGTALLARGNDWTGPVIVKTNLNYFGRPEAGLNARAAEAGEAPPFPGIVAADAYPIYETLAEVPADTFDDPTRVVQRFMPERDEDGFAMRTWVFAGTRERCTRHVSVDRIVKASDVIRRHPVEVPDALRAERARLSFDFGKFDFVVHDGEAFLLDANRTPGTSAALREFLRSGASNLAEGMEALITGGPRDSA